MDELTLETNPYLNSVYTVTSTICNRCGEGVPTPSQVMAVLGAVLLLEEQRRENGTTRQTKPK